jgi:hypothetical protein
MPRRPIFIAIAIGALGVLGACSDNVDQIRKPPDDPRVVDLDNLDSGGGGQNVTPAQVPLPSPPPASPN